MLNFVASKFDQIGGDELYEKKLIEKISSYQIIEAKVLLG